MTVSVFYKDQAADNALCEAVCSELFFISTGGDGFFLGYQSSLTADNMHLWDDWLTARVQNKASKITDLCRA